MKKDILILFVLLLSISLGAQVCTEEAFGFGNNQSIASYNVSGDVVVLYDADNGELTLNLGENYSTANGPDVRAYLVKSGGISDSNLTRTRIGNLENVQFGLTVARGAQSFTIDAPSDIDEFDKVFFYCLRFNQFWDLGSIVPFPADGCPPINTSTREGFLSADAIDIYPNPATQFVTVSMNDNTSAFGEIAVSNIIGQQVLRIEGELNQNIDISRLDAGVYTLQVRYDGKTLTKKLVVQD